MLQVCEENMSLRESFDLGEGYRVCVKVINFNKDPLSINQLVSVSGTVVSFNFVKNNEPWFRIDNETQGCLHFHLQSGAQPFNKHIPLQNDFTISGLISYAFEKGKDIIPWKFPETEIKDSSGFVGFA